MESTLSSAFLRYDRALRVVPAAARGNAADCGRLHGLVLAHHGNFLDFPVCAVDLFSINLTICDALPPHKICLPRLHLPLSFSIPDACLLPTWPCASGSRKPDFAQRHQL